jgi:hypothetical protein
VTLHGNKTLELVEPEFRRIEVAGEDRLFALDVLPSITGMTGTLNVAERNLDAEVIARNLKKVTIGESVGMLGGVTDQSGYEPQLGMIAYAQAEDETGARCWECRMFPRVVLFPREAAYSEGEAPKQWSMTPMVVSKHLWGVSFASATEGALVGQVLRVNTRGKPHIAAWKGDNTVTKFLFSADHHAVSTAKIHIVTVNGAADATATKEVDGVTPTAKPGSGDMIVCFYEYA